MPESNHEGLEFLFRPRSVALVGVTIANPQHWTRVFLNALLEFQFEHPLYLVNPRGGEIRRRQVFRSLKDIPGSIDYVIGTVPAEAAPGVVRECADKGVKAIHFCTSGFKETGEEKRSDLEAELTRLSRETGIRIIGPNSMGIYCPQARLSFNADFPRESGPVGFISQSGGNAMSLVNEAGGRGIRFSKVISYGNACDLNESDFLEYLTADSATKIIAMYIEGVKEGRRFRKALETAAKEKTVILLKGGITRGGARATAGHTGALAGDRAVWEALCKQLGVIQADSLEELVDILVTLLFLRPPQGRNAALIGVGGGASVLITDQFEKNNLLVPPLPREIQNRILEFTPIAGNILTNPVDYGQAMLETEKLVKTIGIISSWDGVDFLVLFLKQSIAPVVTRVWLPQMAEVISRVKKASLKPMVMVFVPSVVSKEAVRTFPAIEKLISLCLPLYYSFESAARAISLVLNYHEKRTDKRATPR